METLKASYTDVHGESVVVGFNVFNTSILTRSVNFFSGDRHEQTSDANKLQ